MNQGIAAAIFSNLLGSSVSFDGDGNNNPRAKPVLDLNIRGNGLIDNITTVFDEIYHKIGQNVKRQMILNEKRTCKVEIDSQAKIDGQDFVYISTLTGNTFPLPIHSSMTVEDLKGMIHELEGIPPSQQRLLLGGRQLGDYETLGSCQVVHATVIHLMLRLCGGGYGLKILDYNGGEINYPYSESHHVKDVKAHIAKERGTRAENQILMFKSQELKDSQILGKIGINFESNNEADKTVYFVLKENNNVQRILGAHILDPRYDYDFTNINDNDKSFSRGGREYKRPCGWQRIALKVKDKYGDNSWLGSNNSTGEWPVAYHGTNFNGIHGICFKGFDKTKWQRRAYGEAHYATPDINVASQYAQHVYYNGSIFKFVLQCRINPAKLQIVNSGKYWLLPEDQDLRPYGICFKRASQ